MRRIKHVLNVVDIIFFWAYSIDYRYLLELPTSDVHYATIETCPGTAGFFRNKKQHQRAACTRENVVERKKEIIWNRLEFLACADCLPFDIKTGLDHNILNEFSFVETDQSALHI